MNDEIEEILDWLKDEDIYVEDYGYQYKRISLKETKQLLDYITNLQQENKKISKQHLSTINKLIETQQENERLKHQLKIQEDLTIKNRLRKHIYKSRCEKAIEYLDNVETLAMLDGKIIFSINIFRNILQNGSDDNES